MNKQSLRNLLFLIPFSTLVAACATAPIESPTHYWQAKAAKTERDYRIDNSACHEQFGIDNDSPLLTESPSFEAYSQCMVEKGYVLRTY